MRDPETSHASSLDPLMAKIRAVGFDVDSLSDLRLSGRRYRAAIPVLIEALAEVDDQRELAEIVRALSVPWARPEALAPLLDLFRRVEDPTGQGLRWTIGNALEVLWDDRFYDELAELAQVSRFGRAREMIVLGLGKSKCEEAVAVLVTLSGDREVGGHAVRALARNAPLEAKTTFERARQDPRAWVRNAAKRGLQKMGDRGE